MDNLKIIFEIIIGIGSVLFFTTAGIFIGRNFYSWNSFFLTAIHLTYVKIIEGSQDRHKSKFNQLNSIRKFHIEQADLMLDKMSKLNYSKTSDEDLPNYAKDSNTYITRKGK